MADDIPSIATSPDRDCKVRANSSNGSGMSSSIEVNVTVVEKSVFEKNATWLVPMKS